MKNKLYCIEHRFISESEVIEPDSNDNDGSIIYNPAQDIRFVRGFTAKMRYHKNCGKPVEMR